MTVNLTDAELDDVSGGEPVQCEHGTTAGGPPGLYGGTATCNGPNGPGRGGDGIRAFYYAATGKQLD